jgi:hypothetical protein
MAIQNSRLNARSMLGTEGAMMAAHYGWLWESILKHKNSEKL